MTIDLMKEIILSIEDGDQCIILATEIEYSDSINLLEFIARLLCYDSLSSGDDSATRDMNQRARQFMLAVIPKMCDIHISRLSTSYYFYSSVLPPLFYILQSTEVRSIWNTK
jgi:hypothetical protein